MASADDLKKIAENGRNDARRGSMDKKNRPLIPRIASKLPNVNDEFQCVVLLGKINAAIDTLYCLSDPYYRDNIFNSGTDMDNDMLKAGFDEDEMWIGLAEKLEKFRTIAYGHSLDWDEMYLTLKDELLQKECYEHAFYEKLYSDAMNRNRFYERKIEELEGKTDA